MLTSKDRAKYAGLANKLEAKFQIGKEGINENMLSQLTQYLELHELVKIKLQKSVTESPREMCDVLVAKLNAEPVLLVGSVVVLYRKSSRKDIIHI